MTKERVLAAAVALADDSGVEALTMRRLGRALGVEAMSLYNHIANKEEILDGVVDQVVSEIDLPADAADWKAVMRRRSISAREVFSRHPWATRLMGSRTSPGPAATRYHDWVTGRLRGAGFSSAAVARAVATLDSYIHGFMLRPTGSPFDASEDASDFAFGIDLILDGLERMLARTGE